MKKNVLVALLLLTTAIIASSCYSSRKNGCPSNMTSSKPFRA